MMPPMMPQSNPSPTMAPPQASPPPQQPPAPMNGPQYRIIKHGKMFLIVDTKGKIMGTPSVSMTDALTKLHGMSMIQPNQSAPMTPPSTPPMTSPQGM